MGKISNAVEAKQKQPSIKQWVVAMEPQIAKALPSVITPERFSRMVLTAISTNPALAECTPDSFCAAMMNAAQLGLEPNTPLGQAYLIPFNNRKKGSKEVQFQIGYKGLIDLAHRSGEFRVIYAKEVYEKDEFEYEFGLEPKLYHKPNVDDLDRGKVTYYYAVFTLVNGGFGFDVMSTSEVEEFARRYSQSYQKSSSPWKTNFDEMAKKTVLKRALKYAPIKTEFVKQMTEDATIKTDISVDMSEVADETPIEADFEVSDDAGLTAEEEEKKRIAQEMLAQEIADSTGLTDEEKAAIEMQEAAEADQKE